MSIVMVYYELKAGVQQNWSIQTTDKCYAFTAKWHCSYNNDPCHVDSCELQFS